MKENKTWLLNFSKEKNEGIGLNHRCVLLHNNSNKYVQYPNLSMNIETQRRPEKIN